MDGAEGAGVARTSNSEASTTIRHSTVPHAVVMRTGFTGYLVAALADERAWRLAGLTVALAALVGLAVVERRAHSPAQGPGRVERVMAFVVAVVATFSLGWVRARTALPDRTPVRVALLVAIAVAITLGVLVATSLVDTWRASHRRADHPN